MNVRLDGRGFPEGTHEYIRNNPDLSCRIKKAGVCFPPIQLTGSSVTIGRFAIARESGPADDSVICSSPLLPLRMYPYKRDRHELLCYTEHGHVLRCSGCGGLRIRFREVVLDLAQDDIPTLRQVIANEEDTVLYIGAERTRFSFTASEVGELNRLLDRAQLILCLNDSELSTSLQAAALFSTPMTVRSKTHVSI